MPQPSDLQALVDDALFFSYEHQLHLQDLAEDLGEHHWQAQLSEQTLDLVGARHTLHTTVSLLGSTSERDASWLWGWANPSGFPAELVALGQRARKFGERYGVAELTQPALPLTAEIAARVTDAVKLITGHWTSYSGAAGPGTRVFFLIDAPELALPALGGPRLMRVLGEALQTGMAHDHRRALSSYARLRGLDAAIEPDRSTGELRLPAGQGTVTTTFDAHGRISNLSAQLATG